MTGIRTGSLRRWRARFGRTGTAIGSPYRPQRATSCRTAVHAGGRWSTPADTARLVAWLLSDEADWVTGQTIASDGGWSAR